jgi:hypothetical protein
VIESAFHIRSTSPYGKGGRHLLCMGLFSIFLLSGHESLSRDLNSSSFSTVKSQGIFYAFRSASRRDDADAPQRTT